MKDRDCLSLVRVDQMAPAKQVVEFVFAEPFRPFRIQMASGRSYEIKHPEMIQVGKTTFTVYTDLGDDNGSGDRWHKVSLMLIECVEPMHSAVGGSSSGG